MYVEVPADILEMNPFTAIGRDGFLITAGRADNFNTMTASWGSMGVLWGRNIVTLYLKTSRYTNKFLQEADGFTCTFLEPEMKDTLLWCGQHTGRDNDKITSTGLTPEYILSETGVERVTFKQAALVLSCTKVSVMQMDMSNLILPEGEKFFEEGDSHTMYIGFIDKVLAKQ